MNTRPDDTQILLIDNGSRRAAATLSLRRLASDLTERIGQPVDPVSLQHSDRIDPGKLEDQPAVVLKERLAAAQAGETRQLLLIPLFFGESRAITAFVPELFAEFPELDYRLTEPLVPLPQGEPRLVDILHDNLVQADEHPDVVILVDHGSPLPAVTAVRSTLAGGLAARLPKGIKLLEAVMERREGAEYDFNGELLAEVLERLGREQQPLRIVLAMLFISPGRHAGEGGDISDICAQAVNDHPHLQIGISPLVGEHPKLIDVLESRLRSLSPD